MTICWTRESNGMISVKNYVILIIKLFVPKFLLIRLLRKFYSERVRNMFALRVGVQG